MSDTETQTMSSGREARPEKVTTVEEIAAKLGQAQAVFVSEYRGLNVKQLAGVRNALRPVGAEHVVYKNTLARLAAVWRTACTDLAWYRIPSGALSAGSLLLGSMVDIDPHHPNLVLGPAALWSTGRGVDLTPLADGDVPRSDVHTAWQVAHEIATDVPAALAAART